VNRIRSRAGKRRQARIGAPDRSLTPNAGLAVVSELCSRLGLIGALDAAVGPIKQRERGHGAGELLAGIAAAQLAGEDFLTGLDRQRADAAGQQLTPVPGYHLPVLRLRTQVGATRVRSARQWHPDHTVAHRAANALTCRESALLGPSRSRCRYSRRSHRGPWCAVACLRARNGARKAWRPCLTAWPGGTAARTRCRRLTPGGRAVRHGRLALRRAGRG
jgi:hypothetical protein